MPIPPLTQDGYLPPGRYPATSVEVRQAFVDTYLLSNSRPDCFNGWQRLTRALRQLVTLSSQWLGGSFVSAKLNPGDIDFISLFDGPALDAMPEIKRIAVAGLIAGHDCQNEWNSDSFAIFIYPESHPLNATTVAQLRYWSKWFGRDRQGQAKGTLEIA